MKVPYSKIHPDPLIGCVVYLYYLPIILFIYKLESDEERITTSIKKERVLLAFNKIKYKSYEAGVNLV